MRHALETIAETLALAAGVFGMGAALIIADAFLNP